MRPDVCRGLETVQLLSALSSRRHQAPVWSRDQNQREFLNIFSQIKPIKSQFLFVSKFLQSAPDSLARRATTDVSVCVSLLLRGFVMARQRIATVSGHLLDIISYSRELNVNSSHKPGPALPLHMSCSDRCKA